MKMVKRKECGKREQLLKINEGKCHCLIILFKLIDAERPFDEAPFATRDVQRELPSLQNSVHE